MLSDVAIFDWVLGRGGVEVEGKVEDEMEDEMVGWDGVCGD